MSIEGIVCIIVGIPIVGAIIYVLFFTGSKEQDWRKKFESETYNKILKKQKKYKADFKKSKFCVECGKQTFAIIDNLLCETKEPYTINEYFYGVSNLYQKDRDEFYKLSNGLSFYKHFDVFSYIENKFENDIYKRYSIDDIKYYQPIGTIHNEQLVEGGGSSIKGAIVGGIIGGDVGAIIGSRKGIKTNSKEVDSREVLIVYNDSQEYRLPIQVYYLLLDYIPKKEYNNYLKEKNK